MKAGRDTTNLPRCLARGAYLGRCTLTPPEGLATGVTDEPAPLSESTEDSVPSSEGTGIALIALTSDASRSSTNYNLDDKRFFPEGRGKVIADIKGGRIAQALPLARARANARRGRLHHLTHEA
jgi:hypothetical protein